jgi:outer membrane protein OmpA-like peptidoglycan-associated protein
MRVVAGLLMLLCLTTGGVRAAEPPSQRFVVYFQLWSAALDDSAQAIIDQAATVAKTTPGTPVRVLGFADPTGSRQANVLLADLRAQVVVDQLVAGGIGTARIHQRGHGPVQFASTSQESRRVEIAIGGR